MKLFKSRMRYYSCIRKHQEFFVSLYLCHCDVCHDTSFFQYPRLFVECCVKENVSVECSLHQDVSSLCFSSFHRHSCSLLVVSALYQFYVFLVALNDEAQVFVHLSSRREYKFGNPVVQCHVDYFLRMTVMRACKRNNFLFVSLS